MDEYEENCVHIPKVKGHIDTVAMDSCIDYIGGMYHALELGNPGMFDYYCSLYHRVVYAVSGERRKEFHKMNKTVREYREKRQHLGGVLQDYGQMPRTLGLETQMEFQGS